MENRSYGMLVVGTLVAFGAIGIAFLTTQNSEEQRVASENNVTASRTAPSGSSAAIDTDKDGVPDWKEVLWSLDPHNPDTDGDGIGDAEEIAGVANNSTAEADSTNQPYVAPKALTPTEAVSRELFAGYAQYKQGGALQSADAQLAVSETLARNISPIEAAPSYTVSNIVISPSTPITEYETELTNAFKKTGEVREYELATFTRVVETENFSELVKLITAGAIYNEVVGLLLILEVPDTLAAGHLAVVNTLSTLAYATENLSTWNGDPLVGLELVNQFATAEQNFSDAISNLYALINTLK